MKTLLPLLGLLALGSACATVPEATAGRRRPLDTACYAPAACWGGRRVCDWNEEKRCRVCSCESLTRSQFGMSRPR